jgi:hypothetical protein
VKADSLRDDVDLYAKGFLGRHGAGAEDMARRRAKEHRQTGDLEGERVWRMVAVRVQLLHEKAEAH